MSFLYSSELKLINKPINKLYKINPHKTLLSPMAFLVEAASLKKPCGVSPLLPLPFIIER